MATSRHFTRGLRAAAAAAFTALLVVGLPGPAHADPAGTATTTPHTSDEATAQIQKLTEEAGTVAEQYNLANVKLAKYRKELAQAQAELKKIAGQIGDLNGQVRTIATSAYTNGHLSSFSAFMTSGSPQSFLDQLSALDMIASKQSSVLTSLEKAKAGAVAARKQAQKAETGAEHTSAELSNKKASIQKRIAQLRELKSKLSAQEQAALAAQEGSTDRAQVAQEAASTPQDDSTAPPPSSSGGESSAAAIAVATAEAQIGKPYVWAAAGPDSFDCSGLMLYAWAKAGVSLPHSSSIQATEGPQVSESELEPGDLVGFYSPIHHVAMYVGNGMVIHAPDFGETVKYAPLSSMPFAAASRPG
ncbi:MAG TPA: NlpC/P60 family protein [Mycobacteriales bacterium]|nr:NlpC/P60 family protein [Mycobacteriales bacterium]